MYPLYNDFSGVVRMVTQSNNEYAIYFKRRDEYDSAKVKEIYGETYGTIPSRTFNSLVSDEEGSFFFGRELTSYEECRKMFDVLKKTGCYEIIMFVGGICIGEVG